MFNVLAVICGILAVGLMIAAIWNFIKSIIVLNKRNILLAIAGVVFWPITQIIYYLSEAKTLSSEDKKILINSIWMWFAAMFFGTLTGICLYAAQ